MKRATGAVCPESNMAKHAINITRPGWAALLLSGLSLLIAPAAFGQASNYDAGKTPAQLFASDCSACHKSPVGLSKAGGLFGLDGFLRAHYTTGRQSAAVLAAYLYAMDAAAAQSAKPAAKRGPKSEAATTKRSKTGDRKPGEARPADAKPADAKPEAKPDTT